MRQSDRPFFSGRLSPSARCGTVVGWLFLWGTGGRWVGTAGLRGVLAAGSNRMNVYTVAQATQGIAN